MAIAPVNKFISLAVPVAPGEQKLYEVPTGASSLVLYAQVANVGVGTYPTVTFIQRRQTRSTGNTRDVRVIKDVEIPPNDALILIDGRMVLEKTPLVVDSLYISGTQTGIQTITDVLYNEPTGVVTVTTMDPHGFSSGSEIPMAGFALLVLLKLELQPQYFQVLKHLMLLILLLIRLVHQKHSHLLLVVQ